MSALKHNFEKVGDHWEKKEQSGPSDPRAKKGTPAARRGRDETYGGVDVEQSKQELYERAKDLGVKGRSTMSKRQLAQAVADQQT